MLQGTDHRRYNVKATLCLALLMLLQHPLWAQPGKLDSLKNELSISRENRIAVLLAIAQYFHKTNLDSSLAYTKKAFAIAQTKGHEHMLVEVYNEFGRIKILSVAFEEALEYFLKAEVLCKQKTPPNKDELLRIYSNLGVIYERQNELEKSLRYFMDAIRLIDEEEKEKASPTPSALYAPIYNNLANTLIKLKDTTKAVVYQKKGLAYALAANDHQNASNLSNNIGKVLLEQHKPLEAYPYLQQGVALRQQINDERGLSFSYRNIALYYIAIGELDSAKRSVQQSLALARKHGGMLDASNQSYSVLADIYERQGRYDSALAAYRLNVQYHDSVFGGAKFKELARIEAKYEMMRRTQQELVEQKAREFRVFLIILALVSGLIIVSLLFVVQKFRSKNQALKYQQLKLSEEKLQQETKNLNLELEYKSKDLATHVLYLLKKDELIHKIVQKLSSFKKELATENQQKIVRITRELSGILNRQDNSWHEFELRFKEVHRDFYEKLTSGYPDLTPKERRLCALLKLNMTTKEISSITHQSTRSIDVARTRLRKKFNLTNSEVGLVDFLSKF